MIRFKISFKNVNIWLCLLTLVNFCIIHSAVAQYQVHTWLNFEQGFTEQAVPFGLFAKDRVRIVPYKSILQAPVGLYNDYVERENSKMGLVLTSNPDAEADNYIGGIASNVILQRARLGLKGKALFQADFFIPATPLPLPNVAVLAMEPMLPGEIVPRSFYRFGISRNRQLYFSHVVKGSETANLYKFDEKLTSMIPRPGWHRFAIVFEGYKTIRCYIDGREVGFSPLEDISLQSLQVGVILAEPKLSYFAYVDNLSIQWTYEEAALPASPWAWSWTSSRPPAIPPRTTPQPSSAQPQPQSQQFTPQWFEPKDAWNYAREQQKPLFVYLYAPTVKTCTQFEQILNRNPQAQEFLKKHILTKIDTNQLQGGTYAKQFNIFRVPAVIVFDANGNETGRAIFTPKDTWESFIQQLQKQ